MKTEYADDQMNFCDLDSWDGKMFSVLFPPDAPKARTFASSSKKSHGSSAVPFMSLDLTPGAGNLLGESYWELCSPSLGGSSMRNTGESPREEKESTLSQILEEHPPKKYYLTATACKGILRRAEERGKPLPPQLQAALEMQSGQRSVCEMEPGHDAPGAYHINQRNEGIDLGHVSGALMATQNMQMQTFVAFAQNQRDEVRDLHDLAGALGAQPGMKQQTFIASGVMTKGNGETSLTPELHGTLSCGGGQAGQGYPCVLTASFSAGAGASAGTIGYAEEVTPTLKGSPSGNCMPSVVYLHDQGGQRMDVCENMTGTLRASEKGHQPLVYENHGIEARVRESGEISPTVTARYGTGGGNTPLVQEDSDVYCIVGNIIDRQPENGGNGCGYQQDLAYTLTALDRHAVYARQRVDEFKNDNIASTQSARQAKDATDLVVESDRQYAQLIRRLTPLECERLQGFPDGWTNIPGASDSARYRALGNSVAIPCVEFIMKSLNEVASLGM